MQCEKPTVHASLIQAQLRGIFTELSNTSSDRLARERKFLPAAVLIGAAVDHMSEAGTNPVAAQALCVEALSVLGEHARLEEVLDDLSAVLSGTADYLC